MAQVTVTIAGRVYRMACADGEQPHLENLARAVDAKIEVLRGSFGEIGDQRIIVMTALTFADELSEANRRIAALEMDIFNARDGQHTILTESDAASRSAIESLSNIANRIDAIVQNLNSNRA